MSKTLPHGRVPSAGIDDKLLRGAIMKLSETIVALDERLRQIEKTLKTIQRKGG